MVCLCAAMPMHGSTHRLGKTLGLLDPENPLRFRACREQGQRSCTRCCLEVLYQRDPEWFVQVATTGKQPVEQLSCMPYGNHKRDHKRTYRRRHVSWRRADDSGLDAAGGGLESELRADRTQRRVEARAKTIDEWVGGLSSFSAARRRQDTFVETTLLDLLDAGACVPACARILHVSFDKLYYRTKSSAALRRGTGREQAHMSAARAAQGEDVRDTLIDAEELARMDVKDLSPDGPNTDRLDEETISRGRQEYREAVVQGRVQANRWLLDKLRCRVFGRKTGISKEFMRLWVGVLHKKCRFLRRLAALSVAHGDPHLQNVFFHQISTRSCARVARITSFLRSMHS